MSPAMPSDLKPPTEYTGRDRYINWIEDYLGVTLAEAQKEIVYTIMDNQRTLIVGGNGFGKTYVLACFSLAFLFVNYPTTVLATSGTYSKLNRTYCKPIEQLHGDIEHIVPGEYLKSPPRIKVEGEPEMYLEAAAPQDSGELEGVHNEHVLAIIEEADKKRIQKDTFDSLESLLTDANDKLVAVANPPKDEANIVYDTMKADGWEKVQFSSFDSKNALIEMNHEDPYIRDEDGEVVVDDVLDYPKLKPEVREEMIPEMTRISQIKQDWEAWNGEPWPVEEGGGWQEAARIAEQSWEREDLNVQWYRRRLGVIPPSAADALRPFTVEDVRHAFEGPAPQKDGTPDGLAWDVARGAGTQADANALAAVWGNDIEIIKRWKAGDHITNKEIVRKEIDEDSWRATFAIDTVGVGDESVDRVDMWYHDVEPFNAQSVAYEPKKYADKWTEGMVKIGEYLQNGGKITNRKLREELIAAARTVELEEEYSKTADADRFVATPKSEIAARLNRSPDCLDAAYMAVLMAENDAGGGRDTVPGSLF